MAFGVLGRSGGSDSHRDTCRAGIGKQSSPELDCFGRNRLRDLGRPQSCEAHREAISGNRA